MENTKKQIKGVIEFWGGAGNVTGSNFLFYDQNQPSEKYLIDCGLIQGSRVCEKKNYDAFPYPPATISALFVTHAHLDHIGRIPRLVRQGFRGKIYSTPPTREVAEYSLIDSLAVLDKEARSEELEPLYSLDDVKQTMSQWESLDYHQPLTLGDWVVVLRNSGHILGSAMVEFMTPTGSKVVFTGDLGNSPSPLLPDCESISDATYLVMESVYGDRNHENRDVRRHLLEDVIEETMKRGGTLMIPTFSIERTQEILFEIENMMESSRIPLVPVFLDSPLGIKVTAVYKKYQNYFNSGVTSIVRSSDGSIFRFPQLHMTLSTDESKAILQANPRKIIIAGSGMSTGGRIVHHEKNYLPDPNSTLLLVGYQEAGSLGRILQDGVKTVKIMGEQITVRARVESISGYSAHKDSDHLLEFVRGTADVVKQVFVCMGEPKSSLFLVQRIRDYLGVRAEAPIDGEKRQLDL